MVVKYLEIFHMGESESVGLLRTNWEMSLTYSLKIICGRYPKSSRARDG